MIQEMIRFEHVSFQYERGKRILEDLTAEFPGNGRFCISAPSGKGKSTFFRLLLGLEHPASGQITGTEGKSFSVVFQDDRLIPWKNVTENIALFASDTGCGSCMHPGCGKEDCIRTLLDRLGLKGAENMLPRELSGGMSRRVCLARALCHKSDILILDEAFTGLDEEIKRICLAVTDTCSQNRTIFMASHDRADADALHAGIVTL